MYQKDINDYSVAIERDPGDAEAYYNRGVAYGSLGENQKAIDDYSMVILNMLNETDWHLAGIFYRRGEVWEDLERLTLEDGDLGTEELD